MAPRGRRVPSKTFRIATFNAENLFARYDFDKGAPPTREDGFSINDLAFEVNDKTEKELTARCIREVNADVIALQEIESLPVLDRFASEYLSDMKYAHRILVDSHDPRQIDVAVLSKHPIANVRTHRHERTADKKSWLFSRDCLEVEVAPFKANPVTLYVNHFKSMLEKGAKDGRNATKARRLHQCERVADVVDDRWQAGAYEGSFVVLGDFNDYVDPITSLTPLVKHKGLENVMTRRPAGDQWTHYYAAKKEYHQLDYVLLSRGLDERAGEPAPGVVRMGASTAATRYAGPRFPGVTKTTIASDHCPVFVDVPLAAL